MLRKADFGNIPIIINSIYDGKEFGETNHYEVSENLSQEMVNHLNKQKYTCEAIEESFVLLLEKEVLDKIINTGLQ